MIINQDKWWKRLWAPLVCYLVWLWAAFILPSAPVMPIMIASGILGGGSFVYVLWRAIK